MTVEFRALARRAYSLVPGKQPVFEVLRRVSSIPEPVFRHLHFDGVFRVTGEGGGFRMRHRGNQLENELFWRGLDDGWEAETVALWRTLAADARCILDVGAHSGLFGLVGASVSPQARVVAFEPVAEVFERLVENSRLNGERMECVRAAVSDTDGVVTLFTPTGRSPLSASLEADFLTGHQVAPQQVPAVTMDHYAQAHGIAPDLVKIDVEGHEASVIRGMMDTLREHRPALVMEVLTRAAALELSGLLSPIGYRAYDIGSTPEVRRLTGEWRPGSHGNLLLRAT